MKKLVRYFLQGLLYITPLAVTLYVIVVAFIWIDGLLRGLQIFQEDGRFSDFSFPGLGILIIVIGVTLIGYLGQKFLTTPIMNMIESMLDRAPLIKVIYTSVKDLISAFVGKDRKFNQPVLVKLDTNNVIERLGFVTNTELTSIGIDDKIAVYMPSSYGLLGELVIVPRENVKLLDAHSADVMKFIVSGGVTGLK